MSIISCVYELKEGVPGMRKLAEFSVPPKQALINYIHYSSGNSCTWDYPTDMPGIRESKTAPDHFYYDDLKHKRVLASYPIG